MWIVQGTTQSPYEATAQLKKKHATEEFANGQDWRWQINKRQKVPSPFFFTVCPLLMLAVSLNLAITSVDNLSLYICISGTCTDMSAVCCWLQLRRRTQTSLHITRLAIPCPSACDSVLLLLNAGPTYIGAALMVTVMHFSLTAKLREGSLYVRLISLKHMGPSQKLRAYSLQCAEGP